MQPSFLPYRSTEVNSSLYGFTKELTLLSYVPKKSKAVLTLSSTHISANDDQNGKPSMISDYNIFKGGVDSLDLKCANSSPSKGTTRWPIAFFAMVNVQWSKCMHSLPTL